MSALRTRHTLLPRNIIMLMFQVLISVRGWLNPRTKCGQKDEVNLKKKYNRVQNPRPTGMQHSTLNTTLPVAPSLAYYWKKGNICSSLRCVVLKSANSGISWAVFGEHRNLDYTKRKVNLLLRLYYYKQCIIIDIITKGGREREREKAKVHISVFWQVNTINVIQFAHSEPPTRRYKPRRCVAIFAYLQGEAGRPITKPSGYWFKRISVLQVGYDLREKGVA
jgi:hypothetical protein